MIKCPHCNAENQEGAVICTTCGRSTQTPIYTNYEKPLKSKLAAGLLGIFLGGYGIHNFYLGYTGKGVLQLVLTIFTCGLAALWGFIEGIIIIASNDYRDADGRPLSN